MSKEDVELAKEHIKLAEELISKEAKSQTPNNKNKEKEFTEAEFALERAEAEIEDLEE